VINGRSEPEYDIAAGQVERWRIVNACSARYVRLSLGGRPFRIIGGDGGLRTDALTVDEMLLAPAERVELAVGPFEDEGAEIAIESLPYRRTSMKRPRRDRWATLRVGPRAPSVASIPAMLATIEPLVPPGPIQPTRIVRLGARMTLHGHDWLINDEQHHHDAPVKVGELQVWEIVNETGMASAVGRSMAFRAEVAARQGDAGTAALWASRVLTLWAHSDPSLAPTLARMKALAAHRS